MSSTTANMGLVKWDALSDPYDHSQLAGNFQTIDLHDHTTGKGVQIPTGGIKDEAITTAKLANASVTSLKLADHSISLVKLESGVAASLGDVKFWWRPSPSVEIPSGGWVLADGRTLLAAEHNFPGGGTITLPNLIGKFVQGIAAESIGTGGGASSYNLSHSHTVNAHEHTIEPHTHGLNLQSGFNAVTNLKVSQNLEGSSWVHSGNAAGEEHRHSINGSAEATGLTTNQSNPGTSSALGASTTIIPPYVGLLPLVKVKNE